MYSLSTVLLIMHYLITCHHPIEAAVRRLTEQERVDDWYANGNTWPPTWQHETDAMKRLLSHREHKIMESSGSNERWENWLQFTQNRLVPKFTEVGFEKVKIPDHVYQPLLARVEEAVKNFDSIRDEARVDVIYNPETRPCKFLDLGGLQWETVNALTPHHEAWSGLELKPTSAYGIRMYQNGSSLVMHYDKVQTHVISSIMHIAREQDEPWPIQIEDHFGNLHSVEMEPGEMLFYESAKALHGRMTKFKGKYFASIFIHYQPTGTSSALWPYTHDDVIAHVPPHWNDGVTEEKGSRWAGASITVDDRITEDAPDRIVNGQTVQLTNRHQTYPPVTPPPDTLAEPFWTSDGPRHRSASSEL